MKLKLNTWTAQGPLLNRGPKGTWEEVCPFAESHALSTKSHVPSLRVQPFMNGYNCSKGVCPFTGDPCEETCPSAGVPS